MWVLIKDPEMKSDLLSLILNIKVIDNEKKPLAQSNLFDCLLISWENIISSGTHKRA